MSAHDSGTGTHTGLRSGTLGVAAIVFFVVATLGPMSAVIGGLPLSVATGTGVGTPGIQVLVSMLLLLFSFGFVAMSRHIVSAGGFYVYIGEAFGPRARRAAGLVALYSFHSLALALWALLSVTTQGFVNDLVGVDISWVVIMVTGLVVVGLLGRRDVNVSARLLGLLMIAEIVVILILDAAIVLQAPGSSFTAAPFQPDNVFSGNVGAGFMFGVALFIGFEGTAIYSEEAKDPRRTVPRATWVALAIIAAFQVLTAWCLVVAYGAGNVQDAALADVANFVYNAADQCLGGAYVDVMKLLFVTSTFGACLGVHNAVSRYQFSLAREGVLPAKLAETHPEWRSPHHSSLAQTVVAVVVTLAFYFAGTAPLTFFAVLLAVATFGLMTLMGTLSIAALVFFARDSHGESVWKRAVAPAASAAGFVLAVVLLLKNWDLQTGSTSWLVSHMPWTVLIVALLGAALPGRTQAGTPRHLDEPVVTDDELPHQPA